MCEQIVGKSDIVATCTAVLNTDVAIDCQYTSNPPSSVVTNFTRTLMDNVQTVNSTKIVITRTVNENEGRYLCTVTNVLDSGRIVMKSLIVQLSTGKQI